MLAFVSHNQHGSFIYTSLHMLPCWTASHTAALVVSPANKGNLYQNINWTQPSTKTTWIWIYIPWMWWAFDRFLPILPPWILIWRYICNLVAYCRHLDWSFHPKFPANKIKTFTKHSTDHIGTKKVKNLFLEQWHLLLLPHFKPPEHIFLDIWSDPRDNPLKWNELLSYSTALVSILRDDTNDLDPLDTLGV